MTEGRDGCWGARKEPFKFATSYRLNSIDFFKDLYTDVHPFSRSCSCCRSSSQDLVSTGRRAVNLESGCADINRFRLERIGIMCLRSGASARCTAAAQLEQKFTSFKHTRTKSQQWCTSSQWQTLGSVHVRQTSKTSTFSLFSIIVSNG